LTLPSYQPHADRCDLGRNDAVHYVIASSSRAMPPPAPPTTRATTSLATTGPSTRWGIAANCDRLATMARQRHPPAMTTTTVWNLRPQTERVIFDTNPEMEPLVDVVRALQSSMSAVTTRLNNTNERSTGDVKQHISNRHTCNGQPTDTVVHVAANVPDHDTTSSYTLSTAMEAIEHSTGTRYVHLSIPMLSASDHNQPRHQGYLRSSYRQ